MIERAGDGATADHLRVGPGSKAVLARGQQVARKLWQSGQRKACASGGGAGPLVWTQKRVPAYPIAHQTIGLSMKACTETVGTCEERSSAGARRGAGLSDLCAESVRARARVEGYVRARAR